MVIYLWGRCLIFNSIIQQVLYYYYDRSDNILHLNIVLLYIIIEYENQIFYSLFTPPK